MATRSDVPVCPNCGARLGPMATPGPRLRWVTCPHCSASVPLAPATPVPPRFTWEVYPGLYPSQPALVAPRYRWRPLVPVVLVVMALFVFGIAGTSSLYLWSGSQPAQFTVSGVAHLSNGPWTQGSVTLTDESGSTVSPVGPGGAFRFSGVPTGGVQLNVTYDGYAPVLVQTFVSPAYDAGSQGLTVTLHPGTVANESTVVLSPYSSLESYQTALGASAIIMAIAGLIGLGAAIVLRAEDRPPVGVVGSAAGIAVPFALLFLSASSTFPWLFFVGLASGALGAFAFALAWIELMQIADRHRAG